MKMASLTKEDIRSVIETIKELYLEDMIPWICGYSGGKDSTAVVQLVWYALQELPQEKLKKTVHVISTDTLVESPVVAIWATESLKKMEQAAKERGLPIVPHRLTPAITNTFWVNLIGRGYPYPRRDFRWCTDRMKIDASNRFIKSILDAESEAIMVLGSRKAESAVRKAVLEGYEKKRYRAHLSPNGSFPNSYVFTPIENWLNDNVWQYLVQVPNPWGHSNKDLLAMYSGASADGECPLVIDSSTPSCGNSRFGCWVCTMVTEDMYKRFLGYRKGADGEPEIVPSEAVIVERIFNLYLAGETVDKISKMMQAENYDIPGKTISFSKGMIMNMLSNERYCGDAILQKSVTIDCIEKKRKKNTGEAPMYYVQNNHPAIIDRVTFNKVQEELARRKTKTPGSAKSSITSTGKYSRYALTDVLICGNCGTRYRRVTWSRNGVKRNVWRCISRLDYGKKYCSDSPTIMEDKLQEAIVRAVNKFNEQDNATYKALMRATISEALGLNGDPEEVDMLERKVEALNNKMLALVNESVSSGDGIEAHESEFMTLSQETELLKQRIAAIQESTAKDNGEQSRLEQIQAIISERENKCMEYDDSIVRQMVECIKAYPGGKLEIIFGGGYLVEESV